MVSLGAMLSNPIRTRTRCATGMSGRPMVLITATSAMYEPNKNMSGNTLARER